MPSSATKDEIANRDAKLLVAADAQSKAQDVLAYLGYKFEGNSLVQAA